MPQIITIIPPQNFEIIRDRIAEILIDEISNQATLTYDEDLNINIFVERFIPFEAKELPAINVCLANGNFDNKNAKSSDGVYTFNIDCYTNAETTDDNEGDSLASIKLQRILGLCFHILESSIYRTLGFAPPSLSGVSVGEINIATPGKQDALSSMMGQLSLKVRVPESMSLLTAKLMAGFDTEIKIGTSDVGYAYIGNN